MNLKDILNNNPSREEDMLALTLMYSAAGVDGEFDFLESIVIENMADEMGISREEVLQYASSVSLSDTDVSIPQSRSKRIAILKKVLLVMMANGVITQSENRLFETISTELDLNITDSDVVAMIQQTAKEHKEEWGEDIKME